MARTKVLYHGHAVAAVAATTLDIARRAAETIAVVYEVLEPVMSIDRAIAADAPILHPAMKTTGAPAADAAGATNVASRIELKRGDVDAGFADADLVVEREFRTPMVHQGYIEPHACIARCGEDGRAVVWCTTQGPFVVRDASAAIARPRSGARQSHSERDRRRLWRQDRRLSRAARPGALAQGATAGEDGDGTRRGVPRHRADIGIEGPREARRQARWHARRGVRLVVVRGRRVQRIAAGAGAMCALAAYKVPNFFIEAHDVVVNKPKVAAYRAPGSPMAAFAVESVVDEIARELRIDPIELRLKNANAEGDRAPYGPKYGPIGLTQVLDAARNHPHWRAPLGANQGRGIAVRLLVQRRHEFQRDRHAQRRWQRGSRYRQPRYRRHTCGAGDDGRRGAWHSGRTRAVECRRHRQAAVTPMSPAAAGCATRPAWRSSGRPKTRASS
jgi:CO/xanthine dehydrogenase Mo-binding subunit